MTALLIDGANLRTMDSPDQLSEWCGTLISNLSRRLSAEPETTAGTAAESPAASVIDFGAWAKIREDLTSGLAQLQQKHCELICDRDPAALSTCFVAALQGGHLLAITARDITVLEIAVEMALQQVGGRPKPSGQ